MPRYNHPLHADRMSAFTVMMPGLFSMLLIGCADTPLVPDASPSPGVPVTHVRTDSGPEAEVRAAFVHVFSVAQRKNVDEFRQLIYPPDLAAFDAVEWEHHGSYEAMMTAITGEKPKDYQLDLTVSRAVFTVQPSPTLGDYSKKPLTTVVLVRDGSQWKVGVNPPVDSLQPSSQERPARATPSHKARRQKLR